MTTEAERLAIQIETHAGALLRQQTMKIKRLQDYDTHLSTIMPSDYKDWHEGSKREWPELAAGSIKMWRGRANEAYAEIERLKAGCDLAVQQAETLVRLRDQDRDKANALLRQALEALEKTRAFHQQDWSSEEITPKLTRDTIAAIKQHLGEV